MATTKPRYFNCSEEFLYLVAILGWALCRRYISKFKELKALYTDRYVDDAVKAVNDAQELDNVRQRNAQVERQRSELDTNGKAVFAMWAMLIRYIVTAWPVKADQRRQLEQAGATLYDKAKDMNPGELRNFCKTSSKFVNDNVTKLKANDNMPDAFAGDYRTLCNDTIVLTNTVADVSTTRKVDAGEKLAADNAVYQSLLVMLADGRECMKGQPSVKRQLSFNALLKVVRSTHPAQLKGYVYDSVTGKPLKGVRIKTSTGDYSAITDKKGRYVIGQMVGGVTYTVIVEKDGYLPIEQEVTMKPGTGKTLKFRLVAMQAQVAA